MRSHIAGIEEGHADVWNHTFAASLETVVTDEAANAGSRGARGHGARNCSRTGRARWALYAFEAQQPYTAQSKLAGLREHYQQLPEPCGEYFRLHTDDFDEPALLAAQMEALPAEGSGARGRGLRTA